MTPLALIVHARGQPEHLDLCLASLYGQSHDEFEIFVADTGRSDIDEVASHHARHLKQRLRRVRVKAAPGNLACVLNAAVAAAKAEYVVFLGGDCLAQPGFIAAHVDVADYGHFAHAESLPLDKSITGAVNSVALGSGLAFDEAWLRAVSPAWHARHLHGSALGKFRQWLNRETPGLQYWNAESSSCFREDLLAVNGFDMDVDDWRVDRDLANRLQNDGMEPVQLAPAGNVLKLHTPKNERRARRGGRVPATLKPGGEVRAVTGMEEFASSVRGV
jgi:glycosyltransferase involved in cell wall biosynthesis